MKHSISGKKWKELKKYQQALNASEGKWRSNREPGTRQ